MDVQAHLPGGGSSGFLNAFPRFVIFLCYLQSAGSAGALRRYDEINGMGENGR